MSDLDLGRYGITDVKEVYHNISFNNHFFNVWLHKINCKDSKKNKRKKYNNNKKY